jgi:chromosomal replication initiation ATPase DnaA
MAFIPFRSELDQTAESMVNVMNEEQSSLFSKILQAVINSNESSSNLFFLEGKAGRGKSFVVEALCMKLRGEGKVVLIAGGTALSFVHTHMVAQCIISLKLQLEQFVLHFYLL